MECNSKIPRKPFRMAREPRDRILIERNQVTCFSIDDDLFNTSCSTGDHWGTARHRLEIDDAEGLVDRGAAEDTRMAVQLYCLLLGDHLFDPDNIGVLAACLLDLLLHLCRYFFRIRCSSAKH